MPVVRIRKRPGLTEAIQYTGENADEIVEWARGNAYRAEGRLTVMTDRGDEDPDPGDWVIRGLVGEYYPITPEAYAAGWEVVGGA